MKTNQKRKMKTKKIELLIIVLISIFLVISFVKYFGLTGFEVIVATVVPAEQSQPTLTGTVLPPASTPTATAQSPKDSSPPTINLTAPVKYLDLNELVPLDCQAADDTKVQSTTIKITSPNGSVSSFVSESSFNNFSFRVTEVGNYSFICTAEDTNSNAANSVRYLLPVVNKTVQQSPTQTPSATATSTAEVKPPPQVSPNQTVKTTVNATAEPLLVQLIKRFLEFFVRSK